MRDRWKVVAALVDQSRRALYDYVRRQDHPVSRDEAAKAGRLSRGLAAFHLDKLVDVGLLRAFYRTPPGEPRGRGRTPKVYEPVGDGLAVTMPERRYELAAAILADGVAESTDVRDAVLRHAHDHGAALGAELRGTDLAAVLTELGFEPETDEDGARVLLRNCPFHTLAVRHTALVCGLNHAFVGGLVRGLGAGDVEAHLVPRSGACCVELVGASAGGPGHG